MRNFWFVFATVVVFLLSGCGENSSNKKLNTVKKEAPDTEEASDADSAEQTPEAEPEPDSEPDPQDNFDPEHPGWTVEFNIVDTEMMQQGQSMAIGYFMKTAREDLEPETEDDTALDTCVIGESAPRVPKCADDTDCAPEQQCVPETDSNGNKIENSEHCETPDRDSFDVGPVMISGFNGGPYPFMFEPGDKVYKLNGAGDGSIDRSIIAYGVDYTISGENMLPDDLTSISATFTMPPALALIEPAATESGMMGAAVAIDTTKPLTFKWESNGGNGYIDITITAAQSMMSVVSVSCRVRDDGEFTVPENFTSELVFGGGGDDMMSQMLAMMNMITMNRHSEAPITGEGISSGKVTSEQFVMVNVVPAGANSGGNGVVSYNSVQEDEYAASSDENSED